MFHRRIALQSLTRQFFSFEKLKISNKQLYIFDSIAKNLILRQTRFDYFLKNSLKQFWQTQRLAKVSISSLFYHVLTWLVVKFSSRAPFEIVMPVSRNISPFESRRRITSVATSARNLAAGNNGIFICPSSTRCPWSRFPPDHENEIFL